MFVKLKVDHLQTIFELYTILKFTKEMCKLNYEKQEYIVIDYYVSHDLISRYTSTKIGLMGRKVYFYFESLLCT